MEEPELSDEIEDEGEFEEEEFDCSVFPVLIPDDEDTQEEGGEGEDEEEVVEEIIRQVELLGHSIVTPEFFLLGDDLIVQIFSHLSVKDLLNVQIACRKFLTLGRSNLLWNPKYNKKIWKLPYLQPIKIDDWFSLYVERCKVEKNIDVNLGALLFQNNFLYFFPFYFLSIFFLFWI